MEFQDPENLLIIKLATGDIIIELLAEESPLHTERLKTLARADEYDNVAWHRVAGFVAQTGDVEFGDLEDGFDPLLVGTGASDLPDLPLEFAGSGYTRGLVGMARSSDPNSANSQFFITREDVTLDGNFTAVGVVVEGLELADQLTDAVPNRTTGQIVDPTTGIPLDGDPDRMIDVIVAADFIGLGLSVEEAQAVAYLYEAGLNRNGDIDLPGLNFWIDQREAGLGKRGLAGEFLDADEFQAKAEAFLGDGRDLTDDNVRDESFFTDDEYVTLLYENVLNREIDQGGFDYWTGVLDDLDANPNLAAQSREILLISFAESPENVANSAFVETLAEVLPGEWAFVG